MATLARIIEALFDALGHKGERNGNQFVVPSGDGSAGLIINVREVAAELIERFDILEIDRDEN